MDINVTPEQINKFIADKILQSSLGNTLEQRIKEVVSKLSQSWDNPYDQVIKSHINESIKQVIEENYSSFIKEEVKNRLTDEMLQKYVNNAWHKLTRDY